MGEVAAISALVSEGLKLEAQFMAYVQHAVVDPALQKRQEYADRLNNAVGNLGKTASIYDDQLNTQKMLLYGMLGLIGLVILAAILKR